MEVDWGSEPSAGLAMMACKVESRAGDNDQVESLDPRVWRVVGPDCEPDLQLETDSRRGETAWSV